MILYSVEYFDSNKQSVKSFGIRAKNLDDAATKVKARLKPRGAVRVEITRHQEFLSFKV